MKTTVVTGLLGSGKTTFIRNYLQQGKEKAVVLVNDFGQAGIDGEIIAAGGIEAIELPSGCVCCTLKFDLINSVRKAVEQYAPDHLLIEPSGVASPAGVLEALESADLAPPSVVGIVDAVEFAELYTSGMYGNFLREQIAGADAVLVNKTDLAEAAAVEAAERLIGGINPRAVLLRTVNARLDAALPAAPGVRTIRPDSGHCHFETHSFAIARGAPLASLRRLFDDLARDAYGTVIRAKALVATDRGPFRFDLAFGKIDAVPFEREITESRLVVIGSGLRPGELEQAIAEGSPA